MNLKPLVLFLSILLFVSGCHKTAQLPNSYDLTSEERIWMEKFFKDILLDQSAIFTLCGSKPMTTIDIHYHSDEEVMAWFNQLPEEQKKNSIVIENYDLPQNWEKWEKICPRFPMSRFLFFKRSNPEDPKFASLYFVNIAKVALTLQENYVIFKRETGFKFNPLEVVVAMKDWPEFWEEVFGNSTLLGLLYGYGLKNSSSFTWKYGDHPEACDGFCQSLKSYSSDELVFGKANVSQFHLPIFASFSDSKDEIIEKYKKEREAIQREYQGKDFLNLTLQKLTSQ
jgi:hypothetical protein